MSANTLELSLLTIAALVGLSMLVHAWRLPNGPARRAWMKAALVLGIASFPGVLQYRTAGSIHPQNQFHYVLGAKYFPELGYDGLYDATAYATLDSGLPRPRFVRNLNSGEIEPFSEAARRGQSYSFSPQRWSEFLGDIAAFQRISDSDYLHALYDHGLNLTPARIAYTRLIVGDAPITRARLYLYATLDIALLALLIGVWMRTFGLEASAIAGLLLGTSVVWRFAWAGGSFLRFDWIVAAGLSLACLRRERFGLAGGLLAFSTAMRLFPAFFVLTAGISLMAGLWSRAGRRSMLRFAAGFGVVALLAFSSGAATGRGGQVWGEFLTRIGKHHASWAENHIGLDSIAIADVTFRNQSVPGVTTESEHYAHVDSVEAARLQRRPLLLVLLLASLIAVALAARRLQPWQAMPLGVLPVFCASAISGYYWIMLLLVPLAARRRTAVLLIASSPVIALVEIASGSMTAGHIVASALYLAILVDWLAACLRTPRAEVRTGS